MADGHFPDVELLRRELAALILEWAGKAVKDDPDGPMSTALTRAVSDAARGAVVEQHQVLTADAADRIAEALDRRTKAGGVFVWRATSWSLGLVALAGAALLAVAFILGLQTGRTEGALPTEPATSTSASAPIAPLAPTVDEPARTSDMAQAQPSPTTVHAERAAAAARTKAAPRPAPRELGRPAPTSGEAPPRSAQPVGAAAITPPAPAGATP